MSMIEDAAQEAGFGVFAEALRASPYGDVLDGGGPYTVFAPTDAAFAAFSRVPPEQLLHGDEVLMRRVIGYHFAVGKVMTRRFKGARIRATMYAGGHVIIDGRNGLRVNAANLVQPDIVVGACVLHGIDEVLWPREPAMAAS
ncbi:MAG TPA: fasciclin domain-containing protein [Terricaulis sp.]|nr:fasciclin domain-containing protein [Terricaulis sp.]